MTKPDNLPEPVQRSEPEIERDRAKAYKIAKRIETALKKGRIISWELAKALYEFREEKAWYALGYDLLGEWLAEPEVGLTWGTFDRMVRIYKTFVVDRGLNSPALENLDPSKADIVRGSLARGDVLLEDALSDVETLGWRDLREKYAKPKEEEAEEPQEPSSDAQEPDEDSVAGEVSEGPQSTQEAGEQDQLLETWLELYNELRVSDSEEVINGIEALQQLVRAGVDPDLIFEV